MKKIILFLCISINAFAQNKFTVSKTELANKIKGGWAGQLIGCTFGGPTEFRYKGTMINDYQPIPWYDGYIKNTMTNIPGLYDDIYMDLTFVQVFENEGLDAPAASHAKAYANADYMLWHANQVGRNNILNGIMPPASGHWLNNPQADAIDFQIESDFSGLMSPGMPNSSSKICDKIGHIMNYGDGYYGGVYVSAMYSLAFVSKDINTVVNEGLKVIPKESNYYKCIADVIAWHKKYPNDWKQAWFEIQKKWADDRTCPEGIFDAFNIDASLNSAYVVMGLLYGNGDFSKTMEVSTRCGQDSDCNPSTAGGILGAFLGYDKIPAYWKLGLKEAEDINFKYTTMSLNDVYKTGLKHALQMVEKNGGNISGENITILLQNPLPVALEEANPGHFPKEKRALYKIVNPDIEMEFEGIGFIIMGRANKKNTSSEYNFKAELYIDGKLAETVNIPTEEKSRRFNLFWKYQLENKKHLVKVKVLNPSGNHEVFVTDLVVLGNTPTKNNWKSEK